ncbi:hypothetical protein OG533_05395 [Streptomyces sp. NBC_01186]|uniref:hypothetical protein n=1 Tax=Streptomyces sp. NBC_01186 TaxID=2903765 RepID=UPI002E115F76|nr:hypothetical protein OG533_05395 [Streptomyces sp. NBC_01186]
MTMERVSASLLRANLYVAALDITTEDATQKWGEPEVTWDDLGPWNTFVFRLDDGTLAGLVREVTNSPSPGYALVGSNEKTGNATGVNPAHTLIAFLVESGTDESRVLHKGFD